MRGRKTRHDITVVSRSVIETIIWRDENYVNTRKIQNNTVVFRWQIQFFCFRTAGLHELPTPSVPWPKLGDRYHSHFDSFKIDYTRTSFVIFDGHRWRALTVRIGRYGCIRFCGRSLKVVDAHSRTSDADSFQNKTNFSNVTSVEQCGNMKNHYQSTLYCTFIVYNDFEPARVGKLRSSATQ